MSPSRLLEVRITECSFSQALFYRIIVNGRETELVLSSTNAPKFSKILLVPIPGDMDEIELGVFALVVTSEKQVAVGSFAVKAGSLSWFENVDVLIPSVRGNFITGVVRLAYKQIKQSVVHLLRQTMDGKSVMGLSVDTALVSKVAEATDEYQNVRISLRHKSGKHLGNVKVSKSKSSAFFPLEHAEVFSDDLDLLVTLEDQEGAPNHTVPLALGAMSLSLPMSDSQALLVTLQLLFQPEKLTGLVHDASLAILKEKGNNEKVSDLKGKEWDTLKGNNLMHLQFLNRDGTVIDSLSDFAIPKAVQGYPLQREELLTLLDGGLFVVAPKGHTGRSSKKSPLNKKNLLLHAGTFCVDPLLVENAEDTIRCKCTVVAVETVVRGAPGNLTSNSRFNQILGAGVLEETERDVSRDTGVISIVLQGKIIVTKANESLMTKAMAKAGSYLSARITLSIVPAVPPLLRPLAQVDGNGAEITEEFMDVQAVRDAPGGAALLIQFLEVNNTSKKYFLDAVRSALGKEDVDSGTIYELLEIFSMSLDNGEGEMEGLADALDIILTEIDISSEDSLLKVLYATKQWCYNSAFNEAIQSDKRPFRRSRLMIVGEGGVGKTSFIQALTGQMRNERHMSTVGLETNEFSVQNSLAMAGIEISQFESVAPRWQPTEKGMGEVARALRSDIGRRLSVATALAQPVTVPGSSRRQSLSEARRQSLTETQRQSLSNSRKQSLTETRRQSLTETRRQSLTETRRNSLSELRRQSISSKRKDAPDGVESTASTDAATSEQDALDQPMEIATNIVAFAQQPSPPLLPSPSSHSPLQNRILDAEAKDGEAGADAAEQSKESVEKSEVKAADAEPDSDSDHDEAELSPKQAEFDTRDEVADSKGTFSLSFSKSEAEALAFSIWDFGGQRVFQTVQHLFLSRYGVYVLAFDLSSLAHPTKVENSLTYIRYWLRQIGMIALGAPLVLLGTHYDELPGGESRLAEIHNLLLSQFNSEPAFVFIEPNEVSDELKLCFFPVNNEKSDPNIMRLRTLVGDCAEADRIEEGDAESYVNSSTPVSWLKMCDELKRLEKDEGEPYIRRDKFEEVAQKCGVFDNMEDVSSVYKGAVVSSLLDHLNKLGIVVIIKEAGLDDVIVLNPQWLLDCIVCVLRDYDMHPLKRDSLIDSDSFDYLRTFGVLTDETLKILWLDESNISFLIQFLISIGVMCQLPRPDTTHSQRYLVPAVLSTDNYVNVSEADDCLDFISTAKIVITFKSYLPEGLLTRLIVALASKVTQYVACDIREKVIAAIAEAPTSNTAADEKEAAVSPAADEKEAAVSSAANEKGAAAIPAGDEKAADDKEAAASPAGDEKEAAANPPGDEKAADDKEAAVSSAADEKEAAASPAGDEKEAAANPAGDEKAADDKEAAVSSAADDKEAAAIPLTDEKEAAAIPVAADEKAADDKEAAVSSAADDKEAAAIPLTDEKEAAASPAADEKAADDKEAAVSSAADDKDAAAIPVADEKEAAASPAADEKAADDKEAAVSPAGDEKEAAAIPVADEDEAVCIPTADEKDAAASSAADVKEATASPAADVGEPTSDSAVSEIKAARIDFPMKIPTHVQLAPSVFMSQKGLCAAIPVGSNDHVCLITQSGPATLTVSMLDDGSASFNAEDAQNTDVVENIKSVLSGIIKRFYRESISFDFSVVPVPKKEKTASDNETLPVELSLPLSLKASDRIVDKGTEVEQDYRAQAENELSDWLKLRGNVKRAEIRDSMAKILFDAGWDSVKQLREAILAKDLPKSETDTYFGRSADRASFRTALEYEVSAASSGSSNATTRTTNSATASAATTSASDCSSSTISAGTLAAADPQADSAGERQIVEPEQQHTDVFISYSWGNRAESGRWPAQERVKAINDALKKRGLVTWFDSNTDSLHRMQGHIGATMAAAIENTSCVIVVVTDLYRRKVTGSDQRDNCWKEFNYAVNEVGPQFMVPVVADLTMLNPRSWKGELGMNLGGKLYIDASGATEGPDWEEKMSDLSRMIKDLKKKALKEKADAARIES